MFKRPRRLIIKVCRHKCDIDRRLMIFMPPTLKKLRGHIDLGLSVQSVSLSVSLSVSQSVMREHSVRNR